MPSIAIFAPWLMFASMSRNASALPDISRPTSKPSVMPSCFWTSAQRAFGYVESDRRAQLLREIQTERIHVGDHHEARAGVLRDRRCHQSNGAGAGDQHVFAEHGKRQRGVDGVSERIENRGDIQIDGGSVTPDVGHRQNDKFGKRSGPIHADSLRMRAQMAAAGQAVPAAAADDVALAADDVAGMKIVDVGADLDDLAYEFMADRHGHGDGALRPFVPFINMHVGAADAGAADADEHVVDSGPRGFDIFEPQAGLALALDDGLHRSHCRVNSGILPGMLRITFIFALALGSGYAQLSPSATWAVESQNHYAIRPNIVYGVQNNFETKLDVYMRRDVSGPQPTLMFIHGGGWVGGSKEGVRDVAHAVARDGLERGERGVSPGARFPAAGAR